MAEKAGLRDRTPPQDKLLYHWIKSHLFRVVHADGAWGGVSSRGTLNIAFYNERSAIPQVTFRPVRAVGTDMVEVGPEEVLESRAGFVREIELEIVMDLKTAEEFHGWLVEKLAQLRAMHVTLDGNGDR